MKAAGQVLPRLLHKVLVESNSSCSLPNTVEEHSPQDSYFFFVVSVSITNLRHEDLMDHCSYMYTHNS